MRMYHLHSLDVLIVGTVSTTEEVTACIVLACLSLPGVASVMPCVGRARSHFALQHLLQDERTMHTYPEEQRRSYIMLSKACVLGRNRVERVGRAVRTLVQLKWLPSM